MAVYDALKYAVVEIVSIISTVTRTIYEGLQDFYDTVISPVV